MNTTPEADAPARVAAAVDAWKRKLLDLSRRNRALHFQPERSTTVTVIDERPAEVFRRLHVRELTLRFRALEKVSAEPESPAVAALAPAAENVPAELDDVAGADDSLPPIGDAAALASDLPAPAGSIDLPPILAVDDDSGPGLGGIEFVPYDSSTPDERHTDDWLQTSSAPEVLDRTLRRLAELARSSIEEQGVNTLYLTLGLLEYREFDDARETLRAPLVMLPVALTRKSARAGYTLAAADEDPLVNPALVELLRRNFGIVLPELPASDAMADDYDLQGFLAEIAKRIGRRPGWSVRGDIHLAPFSFQKLVMYRDLEAHGAAAVQHRLIRQLALHEGGAVVGLPADVRALDLDSTCASEETFQIVDADGSQLRALAAVAHQHDLVIEGPPGTGKSQTITNLIATALGAGKTVLFVAEKMAALSVVHRRLVAAGLGEFCLELHSTKASKRAVMSELAAALDAAAERSPAPATAGQRLPAARAALNDYVRAVHEPFGALEMSPFRGYAEFASVREVPRLVYDGPVETVAADQLEAACRHLAAVAAAVRELGNPATHPWRDATRTVYLPTDLELVEDHAAALIRELEPLRSRAPVVAAQFGFPELETFAQVSAAASVAALLARSPGLPREVLQDPAWARPPLAAPALVELGREIATLRGRISGLFTEAVLAQMHADDIAYVESRASGIRAAMALLDARHRALRRRWESYRKADYTKTLVEQAADLRLVDRLQQARRELAGQEERARAWFGALWQGEQSDWDALSRALDWVAEFHLACRQHDLTQRAAEIAAQAQPDVSPVQDLHAAAAAAGDTLAKLAAAVGWPEGYLASEGFAAIATRVEGLAKHLGAGPRWAAFAAARQALMGGLATPWLAAAQSGRLGYDDLERSFRRGFFAAWLAAALRARPLLEKFNALSHEQRVAEFRRLDEQVLVENRVRLAARLREGAQSRLEEPAAAAGLPVLRREMARQRGHQPLRRTLREAEATIRAIKPCFLMSPLTVAQYLDGRAPGFDLVIFDEASQLPAEDAAGTILRGRQLVVVGDPKQLPPTSFFTVTGQSGPTQTPDGVPLVPDPESVLEDFMGAGLPMCRLKWHYRSAHESLIQFSNAHFYDRELCVFPSPVRTEGMGLQFEFVEGAVYEGQGVNPVEARRVADAVIAFARRQLERRGRGEPMLSLGVGTFNLRQQIAIQDELEVRRRKDPRLEPFFALEGAEPFFVKNLENIQGDERDVIFLSVTYAAGPDGRLKQNFGPLNGENGWRRLNVITTRARRRMRVFSSMRGEDIQVDPESVSGARLLRAFLRYAERGHLEQAPPPAAAPDAAELLVRDIARELAARGVRTQPGVGTPPHRIDLAVIDDEAPDSFVCGIECDGPAYRSAESARDRDRLRAQVLETRGWTVLRVWSTSWFLDRQGQTDRLMALIEEARRRAQKRREAERLAREQAAKAAAERTAADAERARRDVEDAKKLAQVPYKRPVADDYRIASGEGRHAGTDLLAAPESQLVEAVSEVVETEGPIHTTDLCVRVAGFWSTRPGARVQERILSAATAAARVGVVQRRENFWWVRGGKCPVRSRATERTPPERVSPEEYAAAITAILARGHAFAADRLAGEIRAVLGYPRMTAVLDETIRAAIVQELEGGRLRESSLGLRLASPPAPAPAKRAKAESGAKS